MLSSLAAVLLFSRQFQAVAFDEEFARLRGLPVTLFYLLLLCLVAVTVVLLIQVVGLILVIALLTLPAAVAAQYVHSLGRMMFLASLLGMSFTLLGLAAAYRYDLPAGASIILVAGISYLLSTLIGTNLKGLRGYIEESWDEHMQDFDLWSGEEPGAAVRIHAQDLDGLLLAGFGNIDFLKSSSQGPVFLEHPPKLLESG